MRIYFKVSLETARRGRLATGWRKSPRSRLFLSALPTTLSLSQLGYKIQTPFKPRSNPVEQEPIPSSIGQKPGASLAYRCL